MQSQISPQEYVILKKETRDALHSIFGISRSGSTETITDTTGMGRIVSDGTTYKDLEILTFDRLLTFLGESTPEDNVHSLFTKVVQRLELPIKDLNEMYDNKPIISDLKTEEEKPVVKNESVDAVKCAKCEFRASTNKIMKEHFRNFHKDYN